MAVARQSLTNTLFGRHQEIALLEQVYASGRAELVAVYGRRRVGKTHLIRQFFEGRATPYFEVTGQKDGGLDVQLTHFTEALESTFYAGTRLRIPPLHSWNNAFKTLAETLQDALRKTTTKRTVIFLDELPWMAVHKSGLIQALDHIWNTQLSKMPAVILVVCGSAASWILDNLIHAKGGLHNRITRQIRLLPFTLAETMGYLKANKVEMGQRAVLELYMAIGGIPHYLNQVDSALSATQNIAKLCFTETGILRTEFSRLFSSLFGESDAYDKLVRTLASKREGLGRKELLELLRAESGGSLNRRLKELEEAGFVARLTPYNKKRRDAVYRVIDPYVYFYLSWIDKAPSGAFTGKGTKYWLQKSNSPAYTAWAGYSFESLCLTHTETLEEALGLTHVASEVGTWRYIPPKAKHATFGAQIDLLFDRSDGIISICEIKFSIQPFSVDKACALELANKLEVFKKVTRTRKDLQLILIASAGFKQNLWSEGLVKLAVDSSALFGKQRPDKT
jgi:AAA+ ATPase superfamily predicted ATPase